MIIHFHINEIKGRMVVEGFYDPGQEASSSERMWAQRIAEAVIDYLKANVKVNEAIEYPIESKEERN